MQEFIFSGRSSTRLLPEWIEQDAVLLSWPHMNTDWAPILGEVSTCFEKIALTILRHGRLLVVCPDTTQLPDSLHAHIGSGLCVVEMPTNDTWARDFGPLCLSSNGKTRQLVDFGFNAWGMKFAACYDNQICRNLFSIPDLWQQNVEKRGNLNFILEGGAIEIDGQGTLLTTASCIFESNRNPGFSREAILNTIAEELGAKRIHILEHGKLDGDDTDGHIDTLVRLCNDHTIAYVSAPEDNRDEHYQALKEMERELEPLASMGYELHPLPMAEATYNDEGDRLPATYANFLIFNSVVLYPTYATETDLLAKKALQDCFPNKELIGIDCRALIKQHGSLHCVTMQIPAGVLRKDLPALLRISDRV